MKKSPLLILISLLVLTGCVERLITVRTQPPGAVVWLNGAEAGMSPVAVPFTWYGNYEVVIRKDGFQTIKTARRADAPFYEWPLFDLVSECLLPFTLTDHHQWDFSLNPQIPTDPNDLINRAKGLKAELLIPNP